MFDPIGVAFFGVSYFYKYLIPSGYFISRSLTLKRSYIYGNVFSVKVRPIGVAFFGVSYFYKYLIPL
mgnify:CR=1 FL=1|jgi:hypothetical protein